MKLGEIDILNKLISILMPKVMPKVIFLKYLRRARLKTVQNKNAQNLLKFSVIYISNMPILILKSKLILLDIYHLLGPN